MKACSRSLVRSQMLTAFEGKHLWKHIAHFEAYSRCVTPPVKQQDGTLLLCPTPNPHRFESANIAAPPGLRTRATSLQIEVGCVR